jgi:hypothetical protein
MSLLDITITILIVLSVFFNQATLHATSIEDDTYQSPFSIPETTDIHYSTRYCLECHEKIPRKGRDKFLRFGGDFTRLCRCHGYSKGTYIHPVDIEPSEEKKAKIPKGFPLQDGKITCITCHDIYMQCQVIRIDKGLRRRLMFLRGAPFKRRTDLCFRCHDEKKYKMLDPHNQINENGEVIAEKCLYCHTEKPDEKTATFKDVKFYGDLMVLCQRCHGTMERHPGNAPHLRKPSEKLLERMKALETYYETILPLDYYGRLTCATCHNPHEKGVIPAGRSGSKGAEEKFRLRLSVDMCKECHGM